MEKLNCKSLMIGDWVMNTHNQKPEHVYEIRERMVMLDYNDLYDYNEIEPIPITPGILEKNGFVFWTDLWYLTTKERKPIHVVFKDNNVITLSINATPVPIGLKYVHQLQHALRLYGIEKEIVL